MTDSRRYSEKLDIVIALVTHLALTTSWKKSRTVPSISAELGLDPTEVEMAFSEFPGLFRKSVKTSPGDSYYFSLRARWALRSNDNDDQPLPELKIDVLKALLEFVSQRAEAEAVEHQFQEGIAATERQFQSSARNAVWATRVAAIAAVMAAIATIVTAFIEH